jgi:hypothetical protein
MKENHKKLIDSLIKSESFTNFLNKNYVDKKKKRNIIPKTDVNLSPWGILINKLESLYIEELPDDEYDFVSRRYFQDFKRRFRVPYSIFTKLLLPMCEEYQVFGNIDGYYSIKYKLLTALQILATGCSADSINFVTGISETSCYRYFKQFCEAFSTGPIYEKFVNYPKGEELMKVEKLYSKMLKEN